MTREMKPLCGGISAGRMYASKVEVAGHEGVMVKPGGKKPQGLHRWCPLLDYFSQLEGNVKLPKRHPCKEPLEDAFLDSMARVYEALFKKSRQ
jgi:hypothetical protein